LISVPAYLAAGLPPHFVLGNNKFSSAFGTVLSAVRYFHHGMIDLKIAIISAVFALASSFLGTKTVLLLDPSYLAYVLIVLIPVITVITLLRKELGHEDKSQELSDIRKISLAIITGIVIGFYDGFFGPGAGTFLIIIFASLLKYDLVKANGNTKVVNLSSNIAAVAAFAISGKIIYTIGIPAAIFGILGNYVGSRMVVKKGAKLIRPTMLFVLSILLVKIIYDLRY